MLKPRENSFTETASKRNLILGGLALAGISVGIYFGVEHFILQAHATTAPSTHPGYPGYPAGGPNYHGPKLV